MHEVIIGEEELVRDWYRLHNERLYKLPDREPIRPWLSLGVDQRTRPHSVLLILVL